MRWSAGRRVPVADQHTIAWRATACALFEMATSGECGGETKKSKTVRSCNDWPVLTIEEIDSRMSTLPAWSVRMEGGVPKLARSFTAVNFQSALDFFTAVGVIAETRNHHPDLHLTGYRNVEIVVFSHGLAGLTDNDFELCREIDAGAKIKYAAAYLKAHPEAATTALAASSDPSPAAASTA